MEDVETYAKTVTAPANDTVRRTVTERPEGTDAQIRTVRIGFGDGAPASVNARTFVGEAQLAPTDGTVTAVGSVHELPVREILSPTAAVNVEIANPTSNPHNVVVTVTAVKVDSEESA
jgi:hypothetical protein